MAVIALKDTGQTQDAKYGIHIISRSLDFFDEVSVGVFVIELRRLCRLLGYNFPGMYIQAWHETAGFSSKNWNENLNPAGLKKRSGIGYQSYVNGVDAARAFVVHMSAYTKPDKNKYVLLPYLYLDERYLVALDANRGKVYNNYNDLAGSWAEDKEYGQKIARLYGRLLGAY